MMRCWMRLRRHTWVETGRRIEDREVAARQAIIAPGLVPPEALAGFPKVYEECLHCPATRSYYDPVR